MATKRTGLGRGIGALIPTGTESKGRPSDVFFVGAGLPESAAQVTDEQAAGSTAKKAAPKKTSAAKDPVKPAESASAAKSAGTKTPAKAAAKTSDKAPAKRAATRKPVPKPDTRATASSAPVTEAVPAADAEATDASASAEQLADVPGIRLVELDPHTIVPNPRQPRTLFDADDLAELVHSVREFGVLQPVVVRDKKDGTYELIMGERRTRASREAGLESIPAIVRETADENLLRDALLENIHRAELNALEEASAYQQLINDFGITQDQLADRIGRSRPQISNTIRLLRLPEAVQQRVAAGVLTAGHARAILSLDGDGAAMQRLADKIVDEELSVRGAEAAAKRVLEAGERSTPTVKPKQGARRAYLDEVSDKLGDRLNTKVKIDLTARRGSLKISFATIQDLNRILGELGETGYEQ